MKIKNRRDAASLSELNGWLQMSDWFTELREDGHVWKFAGLGARRTQIIAEAKSVVRQCDSPVRIALAGSDAIAEARYENIAHRDFGRDSLRRLRSAGNLDGRDRGPAIARPEIDGFGAIKCG